MAATEQNSAQSTAQPKRKQRIFPECAFPLFPLTVDGLARLTERMRTAASGAASG